jgi:hypothetical protein
VTERKHVSTKENPADMVSRGVELTEFKNSNLRWNGQLWLTQKENERPHQQEITDVIEESTKGKHGPTVNLFSELEPEEILTKISSWTKLQRVTAYCLRFVHNCQAKNERKQGALIPHESLEATFTCVKQAQRESYFQEMVDLCMGKAVSKRSSLKTLNTFLDGKQLLRVGGRFERSDFDLSQQHPLILPPKHYITKLIVKDAHEKHSHASGQLLLSIVRQIYWIPDARNLLRKTVHQCMIHFRLKANTSQQLRVQLPDIRVRPSRPFTSTGIDYSEPFYIKQGGKRTRVKVKCYAALFVCLAIKAVHLELVSDLSTEALIAALRHFLARRGHVLTFTVTLAPILWEPLMI